MTKLFDNNSEDFLNAIKGVVESTAAFEKARDEEKKKRMSGEDKDKIAKLAAMMSKEKKPVKEDAEQIDELSTKKLTDYTAKASDARGHKNLSTSKLDKRNKAMAVAHEKIRARHAKVPANEEVEQVDELSRATVGRYSQKAKSIADNEGGKDRSKGRELAGRKRWGGTMSGVDKARVPATEEVQIDELSKETLGRYVKKSAERMSTQGVVAGLKIAKDEKSQKNFDTIGKRSRGISTAVKKLTKEDTLSDAELEMLNAKAAELGLDEAGLVIPRRDNLVSLKQHSFDSGLEDEMKKTRQTKKSVEDAKKKYGVKEEVELEEGITSMSDARLKFHATKKFPHGSYTNKQIEDEHQRRRRVVANYHTVKASLGEEAEQIDELSKGTMLKYLSANKKSASGGMGDKEATKRMRGADLAVRKYTARDNKYVRVPATEEVELDEARGRPKKAAAKDFTVHPKTGEKLMHNNPEHMKRIEKLQKHGVLEKPKTEAGQHIINQLRKASTSMQGGATVHFTHGESKHVSAAHAGKALDKYASMKPSEKEDYQKKISHSHEQLMKHI